MPNHPALAANRVAVVTGAASGIGLAASAKFAALGMKVCMADLGGDALEAGAAKVRAAAAHDRFLKVQTTRALGDNGWSIAWRIASR